MPIAADISPVTPDRSGGEFFSAVSWASIVAGALTACAVSLVLLLLGSGLGLSAVSPWPNSGVSVTSFTVMAAIWLIVMQWLSSALGGYLAGRMRRKWAGIHTHEAYFRDTAHGFLAWALAVLISLIFLGSAASDIVSGSANLANQQVAAQSMSDSSGVASSTREALDPVNYELDRLFRANPPKAIDPNVKAEAIRILAPGLTDTGVPDADKAYLAQLVAAQTGIAEPEAAQRVNDTVAREHDAKEKAKKAADDARKAASRFAFYAFFSLLIGAFIASAAAALGGQHRDEDWQFLKK